MISFSTSDLDIELTQRLDLLPERIHEIIRMKMGVLVQALREKVEMNLSGKVLNIKSGALIGSLTSGVDELGSTMIGYVGIDPPNETVKTYALAHEYGGKAYYWIEVGEKGVLANRETGFFSRRDVFHPPAKERSYLRSALTEESPALIAGMEEAIEEAMRI